MPMTINSFLKGSLAVIGLTGIIHIFSFLILPFRSLALALIVAAIAVVIVMVTVRRMGVLNFFEAIFISAFWILAILAIDSVTAEILNINVFNTFFVWCTVGALFLSTFFLHKKRHIDIRKHGME